MIAVRTLLRNPGFSASAILILGLGCAATTTIFSIAYGILLRDLPYDHPERLVALGARMTRAGFPKANAGAADYFDWRKRQQVFEDIALTRVVANFNLTGEGEPERLFGSRCTASLFPTLHATPLVGRTFTEAEQLDPARAAAVVVLGYDVWQRRFAGDPGVVGRKIRLNGSETEVIGVMPADFHYPSREYQLWAPLYYPPAELKDRLDFSYFAVGRLRPGVSLDQARAQMDVIAANLAREYPATNKGLGAYVEPLLGQLTVAIRPALWLLLSAVGALFLVGCVNLANLLLARAAGRQREYAIRGALGATRWALIRHSIAEMLPIAAAGSLLGVLAASWLLAMLIPMLPAAMPRVEEIAIQWPVLLFTTALSVAAALAVSMVPALRATPGLERGPARHGRLRDALIVSEIAFTVLLLVGAGLLIRSFVFVRGIAPGFDPERVLSLHLAVDRATHGAGDPEVARYLGRLVARIESVPGVQSAGIVNRLPLAGQTQTLQVEFEGRSTIVNIDSRSASSAYFRTLGIPLLDGRTFRDDDVEGRPPVGIVDERVAREVFGSASPIGKRFRIAIVPGMPWVQIVGVAGHIRHEALERDPRPQVYWPYAQRTQDRMAMAIRTAADPSKMAGAIRAAIREVDPNQALYDMRPMTAVLERSLIAQRLNVVLVGAFAALALLLASLGLYGVISHLTVRRVREFGIRMAVGAKPFDLLRLVLTQGLVRAACGLAAGLLLSAAASRLLAGLLHGVGGFDLVTYFSVAAVLLVVVLAASFLPARRASKTDPTIALRQE